jgi:hypothetical protein
MAELLYTDADVELVANYYHWAASSCSPNNCPGAAMCCYAEHMAMDAFGAVLEALTAAGWRKTAWPGCTCPTAGVMFRPGCPTAHGRP